MPEDEPDEEQTFKRFQFGGPDTEPVTVHGEDADIGDAIDAFEGLKEAQRTARLAPNEDFVEGLAETLRDGREHLKRAIEMSMLEGALQAFARALGRATEEEENRELFEESALFEENEEGTFVAEVEKDFGELAEGWKEDPPEFFSETAENFLEDVEAWGEWAEWAATHIMYWAAEDVNKGLREDGKDPEAVPDEEWDRRFNDRLTVEKYFSDAVQILGTELATGISDRVKEAAGEELSFVDLEHLLGLHEDDEDDAPAPRPEGTAASSAERDGFFPWATGAPSSEGVTAIRQAKHGWPETDHAGRPKYPFTQKRPHHVTGHFTIVVPDNEQTGPAVEAEVAQRVLDEFDRHTTRLHLACAAYSVKGDPGSYTPIPRQYVYDMLGMKWDQRSDLSRDKKDRKVEEAFRNLRKLGVQITVLDGPDGAPSQLGLESVWNLNTVRWGQKRINDSDRILDTEHWQLLVRPNSWHQLYLSEETGARQFGYFSRKLLENIDWGNSPAAGDLAIELLKYVRFQDGGAPRDLTVETMLGICGLGQAQQSYEQTRNRQKLERAILEQERWGWSIEWTRWPDAYRPDREDRPSFPSRWWQGKKRDGWESSFHDWKVTFYPPENLAEMNSRAEEIDNSEPHELEPKGWPDRVKAILNETDYIQADIARILEVTSAAVTQWKKGNRTPEGAHRAKLRDIERRNGLRKG